MSTSDRTEAEVRQALAETVERALGPRHGVELRVVREGRKKAFIAASRQADLIVLGAPRKTAVGPMFAHRLIYATACPVVVMPAEASRTLGRAAAHRLATAAATAGRPGGHLGVRG